MSSTPFASAGGDSILGKRLGAAAPTGTKTKLPAYLTDELLERLRNTVVGMQRDPSVDAPPVSLSAFVEDAVLAAIEQAEAEHHDGLPYPQRPNPKLKTGPPIN